MAVDNGAEDKSTQGRNNKQPHKNEGRETEDDIKARQQHACSAETCTSVGSRL